jgi:hippurate hydrolase
MDYVTATESRMLILSSLLALAAPGGVETRVDARLPAWRSTYEQLHRAPELSEHEVETAKLVSSRLRELGYDVTAPFGRYEDGRAAQGVVAVLKNGPGKTALVRTDMDALPVEERTGLPYASRVRTKDGAGNDVGVMHACGHDLHMTVFLGVAELLAQSKDQWRGTLLLVGQPSEERVTGARALLSQGLYARFGKPDYALAFHDDDTLEAGQLGVVEGYIMANSDSVDVVVRGAGGHGAYPFKTKDPVVLASELVLALQTLVSRENNPLDPAVLTVGSIHGGTKHNLIPDEVRLQITVRSYKPEVRKAILDGIARTARGLAEAHGIPADRMPVVTVDERETVPAVFNDPELVRRVASVWRTRFGETRVTPRQPSMVGEDFARYRTDGVQAALFWLGAVGPDRFARRATAPLPGLHSSEFAPAPEPAIRTGVTAMTYAVLDLLQR